MNLAGNPGGCQGGLAWIGGRQFFQEVEVSQCSKATADRRTINVRLFPLLFATDLAGDCKQKRPQSHLDW